MVKKNFTRKKLTNKIHARLGFSKNFSSSLIDKFFEVLIEDLIKTNKTKISSFGTFTVLNKKERTGRNPKTKVEAKISSRKIVRFKPSFNFKKAINR